MSEIARLITEANRNFPGSRADDAQLARAIAYIEGSKRPRRFDLADAAGISDGLARHLLEALRSERAAQRGAEPLNQGQRIDRYLRENRIPLRPRQ